MNTVRRNIIARTPLSDYVPLKHLKLTTINVIVRKWELIYNTIG